MFKVIRYEEAYFEAWNTFAGEANNGTFLFNRNFMEYHKSRFTDHSVLIYHKNKLTAIFPANEVRKTIYSHQGLSYGGLILPVNIKALWVMHIFYYLLKYYYEQGYEMLVYKAVPKFYFNHFDQSEEFVLHYLNARKYRSDINSVIPLKMQPDFQERKKRAIKKTEARKVEIRKNDAVSSFWNQLLIPNLQKAHQTTPVHSVYEIQRLQERFPNNINHYLMYLDNRLVAGTTLFRYGDVAHCQYIAANEEGKESGALNYLFHQLVYQELAHLHYLSLGISTEPEGQVLNKGLLEWKEGFTTHTYTHDFYKLNMADFKILENYIND